MANDIVDNHKGTAAADPVAMIQALVGKDIVLLPIPRGQKAPKFPGWNQVTIQQMLEEHYLKRLRKGNIGVLLGSPSNGLCSIDVDNDEEAERFIALNPQLNSTLQTRGARGRNFWVRVEGSYPKLTILEIQRPPHSAEPEKKWGEWRSTGGQTVIWGRHPSGCDYQIINKAKPIEVSFDSLVWPSELNLPWDFGLYEQLVREHGEPFVCNKRGVQLNHPFFVAQFATEHPVIYEADEAEFYYYQESVGLWQKVSKDWIKCQFSASLKQFADHERQSDIERKRTNSLLDGLTNMVKGFIEKREVFSRGRKVIHVANGMLHLDTKPPELREFWPKYYSRNRSPISLDPSADCPRFKNELLATALDPDDISLLQRWCGALLLGDNKAQRIMMLVGTAGGGKSTVVEVLERVIGIENIAELRTDILGERFELYRFIGKTFLTGKDVPAEFLMRKGAATLKKLVGNDLLSPEGKNSNGSFQLRGDFNVVVTCNSRLRVRLEGDADAWRRRLMIIEYTRPKPTTRISDFGSLLVREEGPGILLWMLQGAVEHLNELATHGDFVLTARQAERVEQLLAESDSVREFVRQCIRVSGGRETLTVQEICQGYSHFCSTQDWHPVAPATLERELPSLLLEIHGVAKRNDIDRDGRAQRGFKGIECDTSGL